MFDPLLWISLVLAVWAVVAYLLIPRLWKRHFRRHSPGAARVTHTSDGHPGDPANVTIEGSETELLMAMKAAGWDPADPITLHSSLRIAVDSVFRRPDDAAPVSALFLYGRKQDFAFEQPVGNSPRQRHHVRFWKRESPDGGRLVWVGSATFDERVGLSHTTGQITHHIDSNVDAERDLIMNGLKNAGWTQEEFYEEGFHQNLEGRNGGGDPWQTDGRLGVVVLRPNEAHTSPS